MRLRFECTMPNGSCGLKSLYINCAKFKLRSGSTVTIDRMETNYDMDENSISMEWRCCYLWDIDGAYIFDKEYILSEDAGELFENAELIELCIEDDAPKDWKVEVISWGVS